jgi:hypothetical protein
MIQFNRYSKSNLFRYPLAGSLVMVICLGANLFNVQFSQAQEVKRAKGIKTIVHLSLKQGKALEGVFQSSDNKDMYVQFTAKEDALFAKLLWNNREIRLTPESDSIFVNNEAGENGPLHIMFKKDSTGSVTRVYVGDNGMWKKVKSYKLTVKKEIEHTPEQLKPFEGLYQLQNDKGRFIQFTAKGNILVLKQHWDGNEIHFVPQSELQFFSKAVPLFSLEFTKDKDGQITQVLAFKRDLWDKVKKFRPTYEQLKALEGKFQFKDDLDNYIQITAMENNLVVKQLWDGKEIILEPQTGTYFYNNDQSYSLQVIKSKEGAVVQVEVLGIDLFNKVKE